MLNKILIVSWLLLGLTACSSSGNSGTQAEDINASVCTQGSDLANIPAAYLTALEKYTTTNSEYTVYVCTQDSDGDGDMDYMVVETTNQPEHESVYFDESNHHHEDFNFDTNIHKFDGVYTDQDAHAAGNNKIEVQSIVMKMPIAPSVPSANNKTETPFATIGLAINGVSFFNENAAPGDDIVDELFTFDQCSGHPQQQGVYHYHVDPVCLIRDLGGDVTTQTKTVSTTTYTWLEDSGNNAGLLLGFLVDGYPVYGPVGSNETDCNQTAVSAAIDDYNGHSHCTAEFDGGIYHYHVKTAELGGTGNPVFWITNKEYYGEPGIMIQ